MDQLSICFAQASDCEAVVALLLGQFREHGDLRDREQLAGAVQQMLAEEGHGYIAVAKAGGGVVGVASVATFTSIYYAGRVAWLEELYVVPGWRQQGIGTALVRTVLERARDLGCVAVGLDVDAGHERAASLYARLGFRRVERSTWVRELTER